MKLSRDECGPDPLTLFFASAGELLQGLNDAALRLESCPSDAGMVREIRRSVHTLKGDAAVMGLRELSALAHELEDVLTPETSACHGAELAEVVLSATDMFDAMLAAYRGGLEVPSGDPLRALIWRLGQRMPPAVRVPVVRPRFSWDGSAQGAMRNAARSGLPVFNLAITFAAVCPMRDAGAALLLKVLKENGAILASSPPPDQWPSAQTIEMAFATQEAESSLSEKLLVPGVVGNLVIQPAVTATSTLAPSDSARLAAPDKMVRVESERLDAILQLVSELVLAKAELQLAVTEFSCQDPQDPVRARLYDALDAQSTLLDKLQRAAMQVRMVPIEQLFRRFPRLVRDVARQRNKRIALATSGQETHLDKAQIDALAEPLGHLVRNAVDHGIETPEERLASGKPEEGRVEMKAFHQGDHVVIEVADDGRGIDLSLVLKMAVERGFVSPDKAPRLERAEILDFIFEPGFTMAGELTAISGRGIGMDVVKAAVERLKGAISVETRPGKGTAFQIKLPEVVRRYAEAAPPSLSQEKSWGAPA